MTDAAIQEPPQEALSAVPRTKSARAGRARSKAKATSAETAATTAETPASRAEEQTAPASAAAVAEPPQPMPVLVPKRVVDPPPAMLRPAGEVEQDPAAPAAAPSFADRQAATLPDAAHRILGNNARALAAAWCGRAFQQLSVLWEWYRTRRLAQLKLRRMQVTETVSLGEKRFVALITVDGTQFLVGGGATGVALLAQLTPGQGFGDLLVERAGPGAQI